MSKDIPIIFSAPMVRALLEGRKTMTRRIIKPQPASFLIDGKPCDVMPYEIEGEPRPRVALGRVITKQKIRFAPGDRLWVRESFCGPIYELDDNDQPTGEREYFFRVDGYLYGSYLDRETDECRDAPPWNPSIHMPRRLSRLTLIVTGVKIERLQQISNADAIAEGVETWRNGWSQKEGALAFLNGTEAACETNHGTVAQRLFYLLWKSINGEDSWDQNPFVVAITFRVIKANIDSAEARIAA